MPKEPSHLTCESGVNQEGVPFVHIHWGPMRGQFTPEQARQFALTVLEAAEGAAYDSLFFLWMKAAMPELGLRERARIIAEFRAFREPPDGREP